MKVLWCSNAPFVGSGYGVQTNLFLSRLAAQGHDVACYANWGVQGGCITWDGLRIYPADGEWGNRTMPACALHHADGEEFVAVALCDAWVLDPASWPKDFPIAIWAPVDHWPVPKPVRVVLSDKRVTPIAMSKFGVRMMEEAGLEPLYVPHGVDTNVFTPGDQAPGRQALGLPEDAFVVGMVAANQGSPLMHRKAFPQQFEAFAKFRKKHKDAILFVHTSEWGMGGSGMHLRPLAEAVGLPRKAVRFTDLFEWELGWPRHELAKAYRAFDVLLHASMGEGFGVGIIESQACGVPAIVTDHSAMPELVGAGWTVSQTPWFDAPNDSWFGSPSVSDIVEALEDAYDRRGQQTDAAREFALGYDADLVADTYWRPAMAALAGDRELVAA